MDPAMYADRMVEVHYIGDSAITRIFPGLNEAGVSVPLDRALAEPESVYEELRAHPYTEGRSIVGYSGWPEVVFFVGEAVVAGVTGNAAYDALKGIIAATGGRLSQLGDAGQQHLSRQEAVRLARALIRAWGTPNGQIHTIDSSLSRQNRWTVVLRVDSVLHSVVIPPGPIVGARIRVTSEDGRSVFRRVVESVRAPFTYIRYRFL